MKRKALQALLSFPWHSRRYLFLLASAWNERLSAIGQTLSAMQKLADASLNLGGNGRDITVPSIGIDGNIDDVTEGMKRLQELKITYSNLNVRDMNMQSSTKGIDSDCPLNFQAQKHKKRAELLDVLDDSDYEEETSNEFDDADILASRKLFAQKIETTHLRRIHLSASNSKRAIVPVDNYKDGLQHSGDGHGLTSLNQSITQHSNNNKPVTAGGAVKSALTRFFNRANKEFNPYIVDLGIFNEGRPKLQPSLDGTVIPVFDDQPSTIIAYSLSSVEYKSQFKQYRQSYGEETSSFDQGNDPNSSKDDTSAKGRNKTLQKSDKLSHKRSVSHGNIPLKSTYDRKEIERCMLIRGKSHIKHTFRDFDEKGQQIAKFICTTYWSTQFHAVRQAFMKDSNSLNDEFSSNQTKHGLRFDSETSYIRSLSGQLVSHILFFLLLPSFTLQPFHNPPI